jgi:hypothetical protein
MLLQQVKRLFVSLTNVTSLRGVKCNVRTGNYVVNAVEHLTVNVRVFKVFQSKKNLLSFCLSVGLL